MPETAALNLQLIDTLAQIIQALTDEERQILMHQLQRPSPSTTDANADSESLKAAITIGSEQLQSGQYTEYDDTTLPNLLLSIQQRGRQRLTQE